MLFIMGIALNQAIAAHQEGSNHPLLD